MKNIKGKIALRENMESLYKTGIEGHASVGTDPSVLIELSEALAQLSDDEREIVLLSAAAGLTSSEISTITGLTSGSVRSKLSRSLSKMRDYLSILYNFFGMESQK